MSREDYFCSEGKPHYNHEEMYRYDSPFYTRYKTKGANGKSAYEIAVENGFNGTVQEWLKSLHGISPHIGENGNWFIGDKDTGIPVSGGSSGENIDSITEQDIDSYFDGEVIYDGKTDSPISNQEIDDYFNNQEENNIETLSFQEIDNFFN